MKNIEETFVRDTLKWPALAFSANEFYKLNKQGLFFLLYLEMMNIFFC